MTDKNILPFRRPVSKETVSDFSQEERDLYHMLDYGITKVIQNPNQSLVEVIHQEFPEDLERVELLFKEIAYGKFNLTHKLFCLYKKVFQTFDQCIPFNRGFTDGVIGVYNGEHDWNQADSAFPIPSIIAVYGSGDHKVNISLFGHELAGSYEMDTKPTNRFVLDTTEAHLTAPRFKYASHPTGHACPVQLVNALVEQFELMLALDIGVIKIKERDGELLLSGLLNVPGDTMPAEIVMAISLAGYQPIED